MKPQKQIKTGPMPQTPCARKQLADQAAQQKQIDSYRPAFTKGGAAKGK